MCACVFVLTVVITYIRVALELDQLATRLNKLLIILRVSWTRGNNDFQ